MKCFELRIEYSSWHRHVRCALRLQGQTASLAYLSCSIDDLCSKVLILVFNHLAECVLDGGIVALDEVAIDKLDGERGFA